VVLDMRERIGGTSDADVEPEDVLTYERRYGPPPERCAVVALTGWGARADDPVASLNADASGTLQSPGLHEWETSPSSIGFPPTGATLVAGVPRF
jgi:hypothetical protein